MEAFLPRKKRKLSTPFSPRPATQPVPGASTEEGCSLETEEEGTTDLMLALLSSLHPNTDQQLLLDVLLAHDGSVEAASASLTTPISPTRKPKTASSALGYQSSLSSFLNQSGSGKRTKPLFKKGRTLHLYDPVDVAAHTPCSIIHNFLPPEEANSLLKELLKEAETFERSSFKLFDNVVQSPHTACFYVDSWEEAQKQKTEYIYNGGKLTDIRPLTPHMRSLTALIESTVNASITSRISSSLTGAKLPHQCPLPWTPNAAFVNCYNGPTESVGWHSDQLTYLGPRATIGSISLGVAREFRVRRVVPDDSDAGAEKGDQQSQISIHLPHNSLLVMHAEMQEEWKHCIAPAQSITPHPVSGNKRINVTYRDYKSYLHPRFTPRCSCGVPAVLRVVQRKKANRGRYFWMCYVGNVADGDKKGCDWFEWAEFDDDGMPVWKHKPGSASCGTPEAKGDGSKKAEKQKLLIKDENDQEAWA